MSDEQQVHSNKPPQVVHLWEIAAVRETLALAAFVALLWAMYAVRAVLVPLLVAFALAYVVDPVQRWMHDRLRVPRVVSALVFLLTFLLLAVGFVIWLLPQLIAQLTELSEQIPVYWDSLRQYIKDLGGVLDGTELTVDSALQRVEAESLVRGTFEGAGQLAGVLGGVVGTTGYVVVTAILVPILFVFFAAKFNRITGIREYLPATQRERIWSLLKQIDQAFNGYVRGQLIVALFTTTGFCVGFYFAGVPYWFVASMIGGILSLIPYGQCSGWILAVLLKGAETLTGAETFTLVGVILAPSLVYLVTQSMETWVVTPLVQGEATKLHPIAVVVVLIIGGTAAGVIGLILAVPVTASVRTLFVELAQPRLKRWADAH